MKKYKRNSKRKKLQQQLTKPVKIYAKDLDFIRSLTQKTKRPSINQDNLVAEISLIHGVTALYDERVASPSVFIPTREYIQKDDDTPLPGHNLQLGIRNLSIRAKLAWDKWTSLEPGQTVLIDDVEYTKPEGLIDDLLLDEEEKELYKKYREAVLKNDEEWAEEEMRKIYAITSSTPNMLNCQAGVIKRDPYNRSFSDYMDSLVKSDFETNKWRKNGLTLQDHLLPNCGFRDDPDYIPPISGSRNFNLGPPANRVFNAFFKVFLASGQVLSIGPSLPKGQKDYSDINDILYLMSQRNIEVNKITIEFCRYEIDLRITYANHPDPKNYKKVDPNSDLGLRLMTHYNDQHHLWKEFTWTYFEEVGDDGNLLPIKKVAYGLILHTKDNNPVCYWLYLDDRYVKSGNNAVTSKKPLPQITYDTITNLYGVKIPIIAKLTYHESYSRLKSSEEYLDKLGDEADTLVIVNLDKELQKKKYVQVRQSIDLFNVITCTYLRRDALTKKDRDKFVLSDTDWNSKYGSK